MKKKFQIKPEDYGFPSKIAGLSVKTISWKDFPAKPPENTWFLAYTYWNTNWTSTVKNGKATVVATVSIGPRAWTRAPEDFKLLQHETGHYWIACLCALQFQKRVNYTEKRPEDMNFGQWCQGIFKRTSAQFAFEQKRYDKQTYHYLNQDDQERWMKYIIDKFNQYNSYFQQKRKEEELNGKLIKVQSKQISRVNPPRGMRTVEVTKKLPEIKNERISTKPSLNNQLQPNRQNRQFSVRRTNIVSNQRNVNPRFGVFEQARNTIVNNINQLDGLK